MTDQQSFRQRDGESFEQALSHWERRLVVEQMLPELARQVKRLQDLDHDAGVWHDYERFVESRNGPSMGAYIDAIADGVWEPSRGACTFFKRIEALERVAEAAEWIIAYKGNVQEYNRECELIDALAGLDGESQ